MEEIIINSLHKYKSDFKNKTIYLSQEHLREADKKLLKLGGNMLYHINYYSIKMFIRNAFKTYEKDGYKIVLEHEGKKILLLFNR